MINTQEYTNIKKYVSTINTDVFAYSKSVYDSLIVNDMCYIVNGAREGSIGKVITINTYSSNSSYKTIPRITSVLLEFDNNKRFLIIPYGGIKIIKVTHLWNEQPMWVFTKNKKTPKTITPVYDMINQEIKKGSLILYDTRFGVVREIRPNSAMVVSFFSTTERQSQRKNRYNKTSTIRTPTGCLVISTETKDFIFEAKLKWS